MRAVGIIVEYNPLHHGHVHHFREAKSKTGADAVVAVMSGHFLQRGEPAVVDKWARTEMALRIGVDLVLELPVAYSCQPAEWFAYGAVTALERTGVVDSLCFGSECGDIGALERIASLLADEPEPFRRLLRARLKEGVSYPKAYAAAAAEALESDFAAAPDTEALLAQPNNTLGLHYLIAMKRIGSRMTALTIPRIKAGYHDPLPSDAAIASATAIRRLIESDGGLEAIRPFVPDTTLTVLQREFAAGRGPIAWERLAVPLFHALLAAPPDRLAQFSEVEEGLEHRIRDALATCEPDRGLSVEQLLDRLKTKRYTRTKLQRMLTRILLGHEREWLSRERLAGGTPYLRVLGFSETGRALLRRMKQTASVPVLVRVPREAPPFLRLDVRASGVYSLAYRSPRAGDMLRDYWQAPIRL
jgi:Predicted nucleotidyltransferase